MSLTAVLVGLGADVLAGILKDKGGPVGGVIGDAAGKVIKDLGEALGVEPNEEAIARRIEVDPEAARAAVMNVNADYARIAEASAKVQMSFHQQMGRELDSEDVYVKRARPTLLYVTAALASLTVTCACVVVMRLAFGGSVDLTNALPLVALVVPTLTILGGLAGHYQHMRTMEKKAGVAGG